MIPMNKIQRVAIVGIGKISDIYLTNIVERFHNLKLLGVYDVVADRAEQAASKFSIEKTYDSFEAVLQDEDIDIVLNLTRPKDHYEITRRTLQSGKHVYSEKPLTTTYQEGLELVNLAASRSLYFGVAPDTFLGAGIQTCRKLIDDGIIGRPVGAVAQMVCAGWEYWHPDPDFYYKEGGGPLLDMGPYYLTVLTYLIGRARRVTGLSGRSFDKRFIKTGERVGEVITVEVPTWYSASVQFENGAIASLLTTFDGYFNQESRFELYGEKGTIIVPDPNRFDGPVLLYNHQNNEFESIPLVSDNTDNLRGLGLSEMATAINQGCEAATDARHALHVLDIIESIERSSDGGILLNTRPSDAK